MGHQPIGLFPCRKRQRENSVCTKEANISFEQFHLYAPVTYQRNIDVGLKDVQFSIPYYVDDTMTQSDTFDDH